MQVRISVLVNTPSPLKPPPASPMSPRRPGARPRWPLRVALVRLRRLHAASPPPPPSQRFLLCSLTRRPTRATAPSPFPSFEEKHRPTTSRRAAEKRRCVAFRGVSRGDARRNAAVSRGRGVVGAGENRYPLPLSLQHRFFWPRRIPRCAWTLGNEYL